MMPYLTNKEKNLLKRLKTTADEGFLAMKDFGPKKKREAPLLVIGKERKWWDLDSNSGIFEAIVAHSNPINYWAV